MHDYKNLFDLSGLSIQIRLDILDVAASIRPGARIILRPGKEVNIASKLILGYGLAISVGRGMARIPKADKAFADHFSGELDSFEKMAIFYLAKN